MRPDRPRPPSRRSVWRRARLPLTAVVMASKTSTLIAFLPFDPDIILGGPTCSDGKYPEAQEEPELCFTPLPECVPRHTNFCATGMHRASLFLVPGCDRAGNGTRSGG